MDEVRLLSVNGNLGYGFPEESLAEGMSRKPHFVGADAGSTDAGPFDLGPFDFGNITKRDHRALAFAFREDHQFGRVGRHDQEQRGDCNCGD